MIHRTLLLLLPVLLLGACSPAAAPSTTLTVCTSSIDPSQVSATYALANGQFADEQLTVNLIAIEAENAGAALIAGDADLCQLGGASAVYAIAAGADLVVIAGLTEQSPYYLIGRPDITTADDLIGEAVAISSPGSNSDSAVRRALDHFGLQPDTDVTIVSVGGQSDRLAALESGRIAATLLSAPQAMLAMERGYTQLLNFIDLDYPYQHNTITTSRRFLAEQPDVLRRYLRATSRAISAMQSDRAGTIAVLAEYLDLDPIANASALELTYDEFVMRYLDPQLQPSLDGIQVLIEEAAAENPAAAALKPADVVDSSLVP